MEMTKTSTPRARRALGPYLRLTSRTKTPLDSEPLEQRWQPLQRETDWQHFSSDISTWFPHLFYHYYPSFTAPTILLTCNLFTL